MSLALYLTYVAVTLAFCVTPGPSILLVSSQAMARGFGAGVRATAGMQTGAAFYWTVSALGLTAVLVTSERAFLVVKYAGAAYLIALGLMAIARARRRARAIAAEGPPSLWRAPYVQGLVGHLANPKAVLFYIALLPQFLAPGHARPVDFALLGITGIAIDTAVMVAYAWLAARGGALMRDAGRIVWRERIAGAAQIAVGSVLATLKRAP